MALITIPAADIDTAGVAVDAPLPPVWIEQQLEELRARAPEAGRVSVRLSRSGVEEIVVRGKVTAKVVLECARCLGPAPVDVDAELALLLQPVAPAARAKAARAPERIRPHRERGPKPEPEPAEKPHKKASKKKELEYEFTSEEAGVDTYDGETVALDDFVREAILLEMPIFPLCSETCPGIAAAPSTAQPPSGQQARIDPRLAPLGALRAKLTESAATQKQKQKTKKE